MLLIHRAVNLSEQSLSDFVLFAVLDRLKQQVFQRDALEQLAQHVVHTAAKGFARGFEFFEKPIKAVRDSGASGDIDLPGTARAAERISGVLWEIGDARLLRRNSRVSIWFARRLGDAEVWRQVVAYLVGRPPSDFRVFITTSVAVQLRCVDLSRHEIIEIWAVDDHGVGLVVEPSYLAAQLTNGAASSGDDPVRHASGFRHLWVGDRKFSFNGDKHRQIVEYLFNAWARGEPGVSSAAMFADLEFETASRLCDIFKGHKDWKALIEAKGGACRLRIEELLEEQRANAD